MLGYFADTFVPVRKYFFVPQKLKVMKRTLITTIVLLAGILTAQAQCVVNLSFTVSSTTSPYVVSLNAGTNGTSLGTYIYDFGDGTSDTTTAPIISHTYLQGGIYYACVSVLTSNGCRATDCDTLWLQGSALGCGAAFQYTYLTVGGNTVQFNNFSTGINPRFTWDFGDGHNSHAINPTHTYGASGQFLACLTVEELNPSGVVTCTSHWCDSVLVSGPPVGNCSAAYQYTVSGSTVSFASTVTGLTPYTYLWDFGDNTLGTSANPVHTYNGFGPYNVCLTIADHNGCTSSYCDSVSLSNTSLCPASYTWVQDSSSQSIIFDNTTSGTTGAYLFTSTWDFGDGTTSNAGNPTHYYAAAGTYYVCLTTTIQISPMGPTCTGYFCDSVTVNPVNAFCSAGFQYTGSPAGNSTILFTSFATGAPPLVYAWDFGDGSSSTQASPNHTYNANGTYNVCLTITDNNGCTSSFCDSVLVNNGSTAGCYAAFTPSVQGNTVAFANLSTGTNLAYAWEFGDGHRSTLLNPTHTYAAAGTYTVCLYIVEQVFVPGCQDSICMTVTVTGGSNNCAATYTYQAGPSGTSTGNTVSFTSSATGVGPYTYHWDFGDGFGVSNQANPTYTYPVAGSYLACLIVTDAAGCVATYCDSVLVQGTGGNNCSAGFQFSNTSSSPSTIHFFGYTGPVIAIYTPNFHYDFGDGHTSTLMNPTHTYASPGVYNVCLTVTFTDVATNTIMCTATYCDSVRAGQNNTSCYALFNYQFTSSLNTVAFYNQSISSSASITGLSYNWDFGDNTTSTLRNPLHTFPGQGTYQVCLYISDSLTNCSDHVCLPVTIGNNNYSLHGNIFRGLPTTPAGGGLVAQHAVVYLIISDSTSLYAIDSTSVTANGYYEFTNVPLGLYLIKAALTPASSDYANYLPTYFGDELFWNNAATVIAGPVLVTLSHDIHLIAGTNAGGPGFVGGLISLGANKKDPGDPLGNIPVLLLNMDDTPVQYAYSNSNGEFSFDNVAYGTYKVYAEVLGKPTEPAIVTIGPGAEEVHNVNVIVETEKVTTGINDIDETIVESSGFYPNPVTDDAILSFSLASSADIKIRVINTLGQTISERTQHMKVGQHSVNLSMHSYAQGMYMVMIEANGRPAVYHKVLKE